MHNATANAPRPEYPHDPLTPARFKPFTNDNWTCFAGSEPFSGGEDPCTWDTADDRFHVVVDGTGITVFVNWDETTWGYDFKGKGTVAKAPALVFAQAVVVLLTTPPCTGGECLGILGVTEQKP
jgi:hypothetical protein